MTADQNLVRGLLGNLVSIISETNGVALDDTLELLSNSRILNSNPAQSKSLQEFRDLLNSYRNETAKMGVLLDHPVAIALLEFFKSFPLTYNEDHIHLTGSLEAEFLFPYLQTLLSKQNSQQVEEKIIEIYGKEALPIESPEDVDKLLRLKEGEKFSRYLEILMIPKLILTDKETHIEAAYSMAKSLREKYNVGKVRLKFTMSRSSSIATEQIPGQGETTEDDVILGLFEGFKKYQSEMPGFDFVLSPSFRKEAGFFDGTSYPTKKAHFDSQVEKILSLNKKYPELANHLLEIDTVGDEKELYRKSHFEEMKDGIRKLQYHGLKIRSHHGETWKSIRKGIQSVDNAMNIWHIDTLEHGLSLGINPNYFFHSLYQRVIDLNCAGKPIAKNSADYSELIDMQWTDNKILDRLIEGKKLTLAEEKGFIKSKFHTAREIEHYQHDVLNRMISKNVSVVSLPTSNRRLTGVLPGYRAHPFSWWEKKGVKLKLGTDNYVTLDTNYLRELLILLISDPKDLKITKILMVITGETRRAFISHNLWQMRKKYSDEELIRPC